MSPGGISARTQPTPYTLPGPNRTVRHPLEVRHSSFENPRFPELLPEYDIALVVADTAGTRPYLEHVTTDFVYVRLHGAEQLYTGGTATILATSTGPPLTYRTHVPGQPTRRRRPRATVRPRRQRASSRQKS